MATLMELTGRTHLSYSSLNTYLSCGEKFRLQRVVTTPEAPAFWFPGGTAVHTGTEIYDLAIEVDGATHSDAVLSAVKGFHHKFDEELARYDDANPGATWKAGGRKTIANPAGENEAWWRTDGPVQVGNYAAWRHDTTDLVIWRTPTGEPAIELAFETFFAGDTTPIHGYIDRIMADPGGNLYVVDIKSGSRVPSDLTQLAVYATAVETAYDVRPQFGAYYMTRKAALTPAMDLNRWNARMLSPWFNGAKEGIEAERFIPRLSMDCSYCSVADFCYAKNPAINVPN